MTRIRRQYIREEIIEIDYPLRVYDLCKLLKEKDEEIGRELGVGIHYVVTVESPEDVNGLVLSVYKSEGGF